MKRKWRSSTSIAQQSIICQLLSGLRRKGKYEERKLSSQECYCLQEQSIAAVHRRVCHRWRVAQTRYRLKVACGRQDNKLDAGLCTPCSHSPPRAWPFPSSMSASPLQQPVTLIHGTQGRFLDSKQNSIEANLDYSRRARGHHVGPIPFQLLKAAFLDDVEVRRPAPKANWAKVPGMIPVVEESSPM
ncbi:hypothetical protein PHLGIDRAFT_292478 [Phlebiopsis gigantea 11061_1 CR5-6]|uniref:Uncharacterized protein n=1 Tax=Phlebiopsis gigantea (strain 11061_1 CR5-6) TaxID=745531 RepID=A0A0C3S0G8_PHLG1|nr:hypothetical protein PHLGIDRAFT_292478 [Phlebiopsis gigantea 11061_1 CR5-6]